MRGEAAKIWNSFMDQTSLLLKNSETEQAERGELNPQGSSPSLTTLLLMSSLRS